jgi:hypothetical protein
MSHFIMDFVVACTYFGYTPLEQGREIKIRALYRVGMS